MSGYKANYPDTSTDFESIEAAVMETERGRTFLQEFARRNRHADTQVLLTSLSRIEKSIEMRQEPSGVDQFRGDLIEMARAIEKTRKEISAMNSKQGDGGALITASGELDSIVMETEAATSDILAAAEKIQETAFTMREAGGNAILCDLLDEQATMIYTASSFQDLTAQRTRKVIDALGFLEKRILAMVDIWAFAPKLEPDEVSASYQSDAPLHRSIMSQADVDFVLVENNSYQHEITDEKPELETGMALNHYASPAPDAVSHLDNGLRLGQQDACNELDIDELLFSQEAALAATSSPAIPSVREVLRVVKSDQKVEETLQRIKSGQILSAKEAEQALDALKYMSVEDRTKLFS